MFEIPGYDRWDGEVGPEHSARALDALERGEIVLLPQLAFTLTVPEQAFLDPSISNGKAKNVSFDSRAGRSGGSRLAGAELAALNAMIARFADQAERLVRGLLPRYSATLERARTSFRPCAVENRPQSPRKDDRRLHVDAFPSQPVQGRRILRVFCNVNPSGEPRVWHVGEPFADYAHRFAPQLHRPVPGAGWLLERLGVTKGRRTAYDRAMLGLHDLAKLDDAYQNSAPKQRIDFLPGGTWLVFTDAVPHAALAGQFLFEQTFVLPVEAMADPARAPLRILERELGRRLT